MLKNIFLSLLLISTMVFAKDVKISVITHGGDGSGFWGVVKNGINDAKKETGADVKSLNSPTGDLKEMADIISAEVDKGVDAIVLSIPNREILGKAVKKIAQSGIPFITINAGGDFGKKLGSIMHVGQSEYEAGYLAGKKAKKAGANTFACINKDLNHVGLQRRCQGFADALTVDNNMVGVDESNPSETKSKVKELIKSVDSILVTNAGTTQAVIEAIDEANISKHIYVVNFDLNSDVLKGIEKGLIDFSIDQQQYLQGYMPIIVLNKMLNYGLMPSGDINSGPGFITKDNYKVVEQYAGKYR